jgi:hypothetical protein
MKRHYQKLSMTVVNLDIQQQLLAGSETVNSIVGELDYGGGGSGPARSRGIGDSDDEDDF